MIFVSEGKKKREKYIPYRYLQGIKKKGKKTNFPVYRPER